MISARCGLLTLDTVGGEEADVAGLERIVVRELWGSCLRFRFTCQGGVVHLRVDREKGRVLPSETGAQRRETGKRRQMEIKAAAVDFSHVSPEVMNH